MVCPNCGNDLNEGEDVCAFCHYNVKVSSTVVEKEPDENMVVANNTVPEDQQNKIKKFDKKWLLLGLLIGIIVIVVIICVVIFKPSTKNEKFSWNENYPDYNLAYVTQSTIKLGVNIPADANLDNLKYSVACGEIENNGPEVVWDLTQATGKCKITATYKSNEITKEFTVMPFEMSENPLTLEEKIDLDSDEDLDFDTLTNKQEKEYGTDPTLADTDLDGLEDAYELNTSKTDPNKSDTDADGLSDYDEIELGLDPLKVDSKNDGVKDGQRTLSYEYDGEGIKLNISGKGNIASVVAQVNPNTKISGKKGLIDNLYTLYTEGNIEKATVTITYSDDDLTKYGLNEDNLSIYYYNEKSAKYEKIATTIDKENNTLQAELKHFSNYVVGDSSLVKEQATTQILFILDNSWSMYSNAQYKKITGEEYSGGLFGDVKLDGFDEAGVRFTLTSNLVSKLASKNYEMGLSEFRSDYANASAIGTDPKTIKSTLSGMNGKFITSSAGTNIGNALTNGIKEFSKDSDNRFIVILTDGQDDSLASKTEDIIEDATENNVKICSIGFGGSAYNTELSNISNGTGCKFFSSSDVNGLTELFETVGAELDDDLIDIDNDGETDGLLLADSGFVVNRDGFSFDNYGTNLSPKGHCFGMATFAELYYKKVLPLSLDSKNVGKSSSPSYAYDFSNTYFKNYSNLYDYKLKTDDLKYYFGFEAFGQKTPSDFYILKNDLLAYNEPYKKEIEQTGIYDITIDDTDLTKEEQIKRWGVNYKKDEKAVLNEDKMQNSAIDNDDKQLFNAIYASFIKQEQDSYYASSSNFTLWARNFIGTESIGYTGGDGFINIVKTRLQDHDPLVMGASFSGGLHAINAISLIQDIDNPNYYYIGVYDNNYPGEKRYVDVECKKGKCYTKANSYYTNSKEPIRVTPSLEYDLKYFTN